MKEVEVYALEIFECINMINNKELMEIRFPMVYDDLRRPSTRRPPISCWTMECGI